MAQAVAAVVQVLLDNPLALFHKMPATVVQAPTLAFQDLV
jgi:hypothetical protein